MNDPSSAFYAPPPRYLLESDSSDEEGQGDYAGSHQHRAVASTSKSAPLDPAVIGGWTRAKTVSEVIVGVGQAGRYLHRRLGLSAADGADIQLDKRTVGKIVEKEGIAVIEVEEQDGEEAWAVVRGLIDAVKAEKWTIVTTYLPSTYIALTPASRSSEPPIRSFGQLPTAASTAKWEAPNHLTGLAAAFLSAANSPAFTAISASSTSARILPLPLSSLRSAELATALQSSDRQLPFDLSSRSAKTRWDEQDDEPYSAPGAGKRAAKWAAQGASRDRGDIEGMYM